MIDGSRAAIANWRSSTEPDEPADTELRTFHAAFVDQTSGGQEDFLLGYAAGPHLARAASLDSLDGQVFTRDLLRKVTAAPGALARLDQRDLAPGEQQFLLMLTTRGLATQVDSAGSPYWLLNAETHAALLESLAERGLPFHASRAATA